MMRDETIFALSSGRGVAGIAVLRVSGPAARECVMAIAGHCPEPRQASLRRLRDSSSGEVIDRGVVIFFPGPASFTGEDLAEFHVHGSRAVVDGMFDALMRFARAAEAGEFTRRAFRNGRLDLVEAEGLADLLAARTARQRRQALHQISGAPSAVYECWHAALVKLLARVEAAIDFFEEADVASQALAGVADGCGRLLQDMRVAMQTAAQGEAVRDGIDIVLAGAPNTGKSSLLNALACRDVAITSPVPGTTRDVIEVEIVLGGVPVRLSDTAGLRDMPGDGIEAEGMARTRRRLSDADLVLWVSAPDVPGSAPEGDFDSQTIWIECKADLPVSQSVSQSNRPRNEVELRVSAHSGAGMAALLDMLTTKVEQICGRAEAPLIVRTRQRQAVLETMAAIERALESQDGPLEIFGEELRYAARSLGRVTGRVEVEDLLDSIFSSFCIGK